eukprot:RCo040277
MKRFHTLDDSARAIQAVFRGHRARILVEQKGLQRKIDQLLQAHSEEALVLQLAWKCSCARARVKLLLQNRHQTHQAILRDAAATAVQSTFRAAQARRRVASQIGRGSGRGRG